MLVLLHEYSWKEMTSMQCRKEYAQKFPVSHLIILLKPSCVCCDGLSAFLCPEVRLVSDEHHKVLGIKCLLLNPIKRISFPFHNIIMSQKPFFSALYIFFSHYKLSWIVLPVTVALLDFTLRKKKKETFVSHCC